MSAREKARELLAQATTRGAVKRLGGWIDQHGDDELRAAVVAEGRARGAELPDEAAGWPGKRLVRAALAREEEARVPLNPTKRDEPFRCLHCGLEVPAHGRTARDHCPRCLRSLHVDLVPGDRASDCGGLLDPVDLLVRGDEITIRYRCRRCGASKVNRAVTDGAVPDDPAALAKASRGEDPWPLK